jgi:hypothetical protein
MAPRVLMGIAHDLSEQRPPGEGERQPPHQHPFPGNRNDTAWSPRSAIRPVALDIDAALVTLPAMKATIPGGAV